MERLISIGQLTKRGGEVTFKRNSAILTINERRFEFGTRVGKLFKMNYCNFATVEVLEVIENNELEKGRSTEDVELRSEENTGKIEEEENLSQIDLMNLLLLKLVKKTPTKLKEKTLSVKSMKIKLN